MAQISIPSKQVIKDSILYNGNDRIGRNFVGQTAPIRVYFIPDGTSPYTAAQVAGVPALAGLNQSFQGIRPQDQANILANVFGPWAKLANISFVITTDPAEAQIRVGSANWQGGASVNIPGGIDGKIDSIFIRRDYYNPDESSLSQFEVGTTQTHDLIHEVGHALGLNHPTHQDESSGTLGKV